MTAGDDGVDDCKFEILNFVLLRCDIRVDTKFTLQING